MPSESVKYLAENLRDTDLDPSFQEKIAIAHKTLWAFRRAIKATLGLRLKMYHQLYQVS